MLLNKPKVVPRACVLAMILLAAGSVSATAERSNAVAAAEFIEDIAEQTVEAIDETDAASETRDTRLRAIFVNAFDARAMAEAVVKRAWHRAEPTDRQEYSDLFKGFLLNNSVRLLDRHEPDEFDVVKTQKIDRESVVVTTDVYRFGINIATIDWMVKRYGAGHRIVDVVMNKISTVRTYRSDFRSVIRRQGFDGLLAALRVKNVD